MPIGLLSAWRLVSGPLDPLCVIAGRARETRLLLRRRADFARIQFSSDDPLAAIWPQLNLSFLTTDMHTFLKSLRFSLKSFSIHSRTAVAMPSGILPMDEMRRLVAEMVD